MISTGRKYCVPFKRTSVSDGPQVSHTATYNTIVFDSLVLVLGVLKVHEFRVTIVDQYVVRADISVGPTTEVQRV